LRGIKGLLLTAIFAPAFVVGAPAYAADLLNAPEAVEPTLLAPNLWSGSLTLYAWGPAWIDGDIGVGGLGPVDLGSGDGSSVSLEEILDILDGFFMANGDIRYGRWGVYGDVIYAGFGNTATGPLGFVDADWDLNALVVTGAATFQLVDMPRTDLQVMAGVRYTGVEVDLALIPAVGPGVSAGDSLDLFDPIVGLRGKQFLSQRFYLEGTGLVGGVLGDTDFLWDVYGGVGFAFTDHFSASAGWRAMGFDYESGGTVLDLTFNGPVAGVTLRF
jgi:hypothetical protein